MSGLICSRFFFGSLCWLMAGAALAAQVHSHAAEAPPAVTLPGTLPPGSDISKRPLPAAPGTKTAADTFRELLKMSPDERARALASRTLHQREYLQTKLLEYEALPAETREARLRQLDLSCRLPVLLNLSPGERGPHLEAAPPELRPIMEQRLKKWDQLPQDVQKSILAHETTANYFLQLRPVTPPGTAAATPPLPVAPVDEKQRRLLQKFLDMSSREQEKTLEALPSDEREEMEKTLQVFAKLTPAQRQTCIDSFSKLSRMSKEQRDRFLESAERWKAMSPRERETWRTLVKILPPDPSASGFPPLPLGAEQLEKGVTASNLPGTKAQRLP